MESITLNPITTTPVTPVDTSLPVEFPVDVPVVGIIGKLNAKGKRKPIPCGEYTIDVVMNDDLSLPTGWNKNRVTSYARLVLMGSGSQYGDWLKPWLRSEHPLFTSIVGDNQAHLYVAAFTDLANRFNPGRVKMFADLKLSKSKTDCLARMQKQGHVDAAGKLDETAQKSVDANNASSTRHYNAMIRLTAEALKIAAEDVADLRTSGCNKVTLHHATGADIPTRLIELLNGELARKITNKGIGHIMAKIAAH